jgi:hypothetical protein
VCGDIIETKGVLSVDAKKILPIALDAVVLECKDAAALSDFYIRLLGWEKHYSEDEEWRDIISPSGGTKIAFQRNDDYVPPIWPDAPGEQQQMTHQDFALKDAGQIELAIAHALSCGAVMANAQYGEDKWTTLLDPAGHPFCFVIW